MSNDEIMQQPMAASYEGETKLRCDGSGNSQVGSTNSSGGGAPHEELNKLALDFRPVSTSKTDKCRNFWIFIDSNPELGKIKYMGHRQSDDPTSGCVSRRIRFPSPQNSVHRRKWLNQLVEYKQLNLDRAALSSDPVRVRCTSEPLVLADQVAEPPEALLKSLDGFDDQVKFPNPLQIYRAPVTLKNFLKKSQ